MRTLARWHWVAALLGCVLMGTHVSAQRIGQWTSYHSFYNLRHVVDAPTRVYAASSKGIFYYDKEDLTLNTLSKGDGLSDIGISTIAYDKTSKSLIVAYHNGNIDILQNEQTYNISGIKQWVYSGDKSINAVEFNKNHAYLACGFGLVVVNMTRKEIEDTYYFTDEMSANCAVYDIAFVDTLIYLATSKGLLYSNKNNPYLNVEDTWSVDTSSLWNSAKPQQLASCGEKLAVATMSTDPSMLTLYAKSNDEYQAVTSGNIMSLRAIEGQLVVTLWDSVSIYDNDLRLVRTISEMPDGEMLAHDAMASSDGRVWIAHDWAGMVVVDREGKTFTTAPSGPGSDNVYRVRSVNGGIAVCPGGKSSTNASLYLDGNLYQYKDRDWQQLDKTNSSIWLHDVVDVAVNPTNPQILAAAAWGCGIIEIDGNKVTSVYNETNSDGTLQPYSSGTFTSLLTGAVTYDWNGNLWMLNSLSDYGLVAHLTDGSWRKFNTASVVNGAMIYNILFDTVNGYLWFSGRDNKIYVHNGGELISWVDPNQGSRLQTSNVNCMVQDQNGHIWIGTDKGIKVIYDGYKAFENGGSGELSPVNCSNIIFTEGDLVEYLLAYESITSIVVDGANRKWVGTAAGGLYLLSSTGLEQIENFTTSNSPLFSNKIVTVGIHPVTGEVFIGTDMGLQSYRSTATYADIEPEKKIHVFPNPVRPEYDGPVAIRGFSRNAIVHITDEAGHVVYSTRADGGQAIWYIRSNSGVKVSSGVYFVFASDEEGRNRSVGKILVIK